MVGFSRFRSLRSLVFFSFFLVLLVLFISRVVSSYDEAEASGLVQLADGSVSLAFGSVLEAEVAGANVSGLIVRLNEAVSLLARAKILLQNGEFGEAGEVADRSVNIANGVKDEALGLRVSALSYRDYVFRVSLLGSFVGVPAFLVFMFFLWRRFKGFYVRRIMRMRPEVASDVVS